MVGSYTDSLLRVDSCNVIISVLELSIFILRFIHVQRPDSFVTTSSPQRLMRLHLVGEYVSFHHLVGFWVFVLGGGTALIA